MRLGTMGRRTVVTPEAGGLGRHTLYTQRELMRGYDIPPAPDLQKNYAKAPAYGNAATEPEPAALHHGLRGVHRDGFL